MNWKIFLVSIILVASFAFALENNTVDLKVTGVTPNPRHIYPGTQDVSLIVTLVNTGTATLTDVETKLDLSGDFERSFSSSDSYYAGTIMPNIPSMLKFDINIDEEAETGEECFDLDIVSERDSFTKEVCLDIEARPIVEISSKDVPTMSPGNTFPVEVEVENIGEQDAQDVKVKLILQSTMPFTIKNNLQELGRLDADEKSTALFEVAVDDDAKLKDYKVEAQIRYTSDERNDENVYIGYENIKFKVSGSQGGMSGAFTDLGGLFWGIVVVLLIIIGAFAFLIIKGKKK